MIDLYYWPTVNGRKIAIMLEEIGLPYSVIPVDFTRGETQSSTFRRINPNGKIPAIVDRDGPGGQPLAIFESAAILIYLADKTRSLLPADGAERYVTLEWLIFQAANVGPMLGQLAHFHDYAPVQDEYALARYSSEARRLYGVLEERLSATDYLAGAAFSIADISCWTWVMPDRQGQDWADWPAIKAWHDRVGARPAVQRGNLVRRDLQPPGAIALDAAQRQQLYGWQQGGDG